MLKVLFFGSLAEQVGCDSLTLEWNAHWSRVADVIAALRQSQPAVARPLDGRRGLLIAVNQQVVKTDARLHDGDELAFLPPVTGG